MSSLSSSTIVVEHILIIIRDSCSGKLLSGQEMLAVRPFNWLDFGYGQDVMAIIYGRIGVLNCRFIRAEVLFK